MIGEYFIEKWIGAGAKKEKRSKVSAKILTKSELYEVERATEHLLAKMREAN